LPCAGRELHQLVVDRACSVEAGAGGVHRRAEVLQASLPSSLVNVPDIATVLAGKLSESGVKSAGVRCDLRDIDDLKAGLASLKQTLGAADILVNNAAHDQRHSWRDMTPEYWDERMAVNLRHMFFAIQAVAPDMIEKKLGSIINFSSTSWKLKMGNLPAYTTAKAAVHGLTKSMQMELGKSNIRVNTVYPGWVMTPRQKELWFDEAGQRTLDEHQAMAGLIQPDDIANLVMFLASDDSRFCTGAEFTCDGGWL
jgi:NAD(P)-dependent dehydrogenase (short-subunit alcohol dehydrogenase family)